MQVRIRKNILDRYILVHQHVDDYAWSGSQWVAIDNLGTPSGNLRVPDLGSYDEAVHYARSFGFIVADERKEEERRNALGLTEEDVIDKAVAGTAEVLEVASRYSHDASKRKKYEVLAAIIRSALSSDCPSLLYIDAELQASLLAFGELVATFTEKDHRDRDIKLATRPCGFRGCVACDLLAVYNRMLRLTKP